MTCRWRRRHGNQKRVTEFQELVRSHAKVLISKKRSTRIRAKIRELLLHAAFLYFYTASTQADLSGERLFHLANAPVGTSLNFLGLSVLIEIVGLTSVDAELCIMSAQYLSAEFPGVTTPTSSAQELKSFGRIANVPELFAWLRGPFLALSYPNSASLSENENELVFQSNRVVGGIRIGQLRVLKANCSSRVTTYFTSALTSISSSSSSSLYCYGSGSGAFQSQDESYEPFGGQDGVAFQFAGHNSTSTSAERKKRFSSMASATSGSNRLPAPAFSVVLPRANVTQASQVLQWLEHDNYIDSSSRALMLDVNLYNVMLQYVLVLRFVFEFPSGGGVVPRLVVSSAPVTKSFLYDADELWNSICSLVVLAFYVYFLFSELMAHTGRRRKATALKALQWSSRFGSSARVLSLGFYLLVWLMRLLALVNFPGTFPLEADTFVSLRAFTEAFRIAQHLLAVNTCLCWLVLLLLLRVSKNVDVFVRTVLIAKTKLLSLLLCMALLLFGSASAFVVALGSQVRGFESVSAAIKTLFALVFNLRGVADFVSSYPETGGDGGEARPYQDTTIATVLLAGFLLLNGVIVANLFLVVIYESYRKAVEELEFQQQQSSHKRVHLVIEIAKYAQALYEQLKSALQRFYDALHCAHIVKKKLVSRTSRMSMVRAISSSKAMQKSARLISSHVGALSDFGGKLVHNVVSSERDDGDDDGDDRDGNNSIGGARGGTAIGERGLLLGPGGGGDRALGRRRGALLKYNAPGGASGADTKLLQGMILQLALQNENLIRSIEEIRCDVKSLTALNAMDDASRRRLMSPASSSRLNGSGKSQHSRRQSTAQQQQHFHLETPPQVVVEDHVDMVEHLS